MAILENLSEELMIEILSRLPPESLLRFKSVQKSWYALINDPYFVTKHFSNSLPHNKHVLLKRLRKSDGKNPNIFSILKSPLDRSASSVLDFSFPLDEAESFTPLESHGQSHGLVCFTDCSMQIFLSNPTTREFRKLPPPSLPLLFDESSDQPILSINIAIGFGYAAKSRDFKVVRVVDFVESPALEPKHFQSKVEIYDLRKDKWRKIETQVGDHVYWKSTFDMYHEGRYYWLAENFDFDGSWTEFIQWFDMSKEVFGKFLVPTSLGLSHTSMRFLNDSILLCRKSFETLDIWEMEKNGESSVVSWSKLFTYNLVYRVNKILLFVSSDELLIQNNKGSVDSYHLKTREFEELPIKDVSMEGYPLSFQATFLDKSLLSVKGGTNISYEL